MIMCSQVAKSINLLLMSLFENYMRCFRLCRILKYEIIKHVRTLRSIQVCQTFRINFKFQRIAFYCKSHTDFKKLHSDNN